LPAVVVASLGRAALLIVMALSSVAAKLKQPAALAGQPDENDKTRGLGSAFFYPGFSTMRKPASVPVLLLVFQNGRRAFVSVAGDMAVFLAASWLFAVYPVAGSRFCY
jgi:hypothetical protein